MDAQNSTQTVLTLKNFGETPRHYPLDKRRHIYLLAKKGATATWPRAVLFCEQGYN